MYEITSKEEFTTFLSRYNYLIVDFYAPWCQPCKAIAPEFIKLSNNKKYSMVKFVKVNIDELPEIGDMCDVSSLPTFLAFENGQLFDGVKGANLQGLVKLLNDLIQTYFF